MALKKVRVNFYLQKEQAEQIKKAADIEMRSMSNMVEIMAIEYWKQRNKAAINADMAGQRYSGSAGMQPGSSADQKAGNEGAGV